MGKTYECLKLVVFSFINVTDVIILPGTLTSSNMKDANATPY